MTNPFKIKNQFYKLNVSLNPKVLVLSRRRGRNAVLLQIMQFPDPGPWPS